MATIPRPRNWHLIVVALIAVFDVVVLYMVLNPRVAEDYKNYYIDRSWSCYPRIISGYYPLGQPITFLPGRNGYDRDTVRWCGFQPPSTTGIRSFGDYGILRLKFPPPDKDLLLTFSSWVNFGKEAIPRDVTVSINGDRVATIHYPDPKRVNGKIVIPQSVAKAGNGTLEIRFDVPRTGPPGTNSEPVTLQLRIEALRVSVLDEALPATSVEAPSVAISEGVVPPA